MTNGMFYKSKEAKFKAFRAFCIRNRNRGMEKCEVFDRCQDIVEMYELKNPTCRDAWEYLPAPVSANEVRK